MIGYSPGLPVPEMPDISAFVTDIKKATDLVVKYEYVQSGAKLLNSTEKFLQVLETIFPKLEAFEDPIASIIIYIPKTKEEIFTLVDEGISLRIALRNSMDLRHPQIKAYAKKIDQIVEGFRESKRDYLVYFEPDPNVRALIEEYSEREK
ncbi:MAG: hypothetical protein ABIV51_09480 [Saprospiraceae bacterium]